MLPSSEIMLRMLSKNIGFLEGERIGILYQKPAPTISDVERFVESEKVALALYEVYKKQGFTVALFSYDMHIPRNGVDAPQETYDIDVDILIMPTAYSLTHTAFAKAQAAKGTRVASMPGFTLDMFERGGPMEADSDVMMELTTKVYEQMKQSSFAHITGKDTDIRIELTPGLAHRSTAVIEKGKIANLPGAEAYVVPKHEGNSFGYFTVPAGWGGNFPLKYPVTFHIKQGRFFKFEGESKEAQSYIDEQIKPIFEGENFDILAELGVGTNPNAAAYIKKYGWSTLLAEKIYGSAHFANGNSKGMGGENDVPIHLDWVVPDVKISFE